MAFIYRAGPALIALLLLLAGPIAARDLDGTDAMAMRELVYVQNAKAKAKTK